MPHTVYTSYTFRKPLFWLLREGDRKEYQRSKSFVGDSDCFKILSAGFEALTNIMEEDIHDHIPPHREDVELLKSLKQQVAFIQEHYYLVKKGDSEQG